MKKYTIKSSETLKHINRIYSWNDYEDEYYDIFEKAEELEMDNFDIPEKLGVWIEPSVQSNTSRLYFYLTENDAVAADVDYEEWCYSICNLYDESEDEAEFRSKYQNKIIRTLNYSWKDAIFELQNECNTIDKIGHELQIELSDIERSLDVVYTNNKVMFNKYRYQISKSKWFRKMVNLAKNSKNLIEFRENYKKMIKSIEKW